MDVKETVDFVKSALVEAFKQSPTEVLVTPEHWGDVNFLVVKTELDYEALYAMAGPVLARPEIQDACNEHGIALSIDYTDRKLVLA